MKKITSVLFCLLLLTSIIMYFFINKSTDQVKSKPLDVIQEQVVNQETKNSRILPKYNTPSKLAFSEVSISNQLIDILSQCGENIDSKQQNKIWQKGNLSDVQLKAREQLLIECDNWYDYIDSLTDSKLHEQRENVVKAKQLSEYFGFYNGHDEEKIKNAREFMSEGGDASGATIGALVHLLGQDLEFAATIAKKLGISSVESIINDNYNIAMLYTCRMNRQYCTSQNSIGLLSSCISNENMCGISLEQAISRTMTPNHFQDLLNIVDIIQYLIKKGYFNQYQG